MFTLKIVDSEGKVLKEETGESRVDMFYDKAYNPGDKILLTSDKYPADIVLSVDDALGESVSLLTGDFTFIIPFDEKKHSYSPKTFSGNAHYLYARCAYDFEVNQYKNLALNVNDQHGDTHLFPHAFANVETRGESVFAARNAVDGVCENRSHGNWPYESWGINRRDDAELTIDFGRKVKADKIILYTRADFPHDNWWESVTFTFSDGSTLVKKLNKSYAPHVIDFEEKNITWVKISELIKADDPSPFPALTQMEVYGKVEEIFD
ncbi:MAG: carbohydrate-binding protein [Lachnospiraceae bacterium]|nr:carbohydrate-binding protein [Lachnospiraceae bacterium]